jgi:hypothetical protein
MMLIFTIFIIFDKISIMALKKHVVYPKQKKLLEVFGET